ncbi:MAG: ABC1 kinase family protein [Acidimicrobiia bacterium]
MPRRRAALAAVVTAFAGAAAGYLAVKRSAQDKDATTLAGGMPSAVEAGTRYQRNLEIAKLGSRAGGSYALHRARKVFAGAERRQALDMQFSLNTAEQVVATLGHMKGALMKLGQMASYLDQGLPEHVRTALAQLLTDAPPMSAELAASVVERELGAPPERVFLEWDPMPIASASIGQVHRAITKDERAVAVKVQYPGVADAIRSDLSNADLLFNAMKMLYSGLEPGPLVEELRARLFEELDYRLEAENQQLFADYYADHPFISVPAVVHELSSGEVLTSELATGAPFDELRTWPDEEKQMASETIFRFVFRSLYRLHAFNGDPHPGNYLFEPGGRVTFLDFGLVKRFTPDEVQVFEEMVRAMVIDHDMPLYRQIIERIGLIPKGAPFTDDQIADYFGHFYEMILEDRTYEITPAWSRESMKRFFDPTGPYGPIQRSANLPPEFVILQRINLGLFAILGDLHATANWRRIADEVWPFGADASPSTPIGRREAAWLAQRE